MVLNKNYRYAVTGYTSYQMKYKKRVGVYMSQKNKTFTVPACSCMTLTSKGGKHYWFRTCDIGESLWNEGAHIVQCSKGSGIVYGDGHKENTDYGFLGITYNRQDTWLLDGVNEEGLCGGLLMLYEGTSVEKADTDRAGYSGMELVTKILSSCQDVKAVIELTKTIQILDVTLNNRKVASTMHYFFCDRQGKEVVLEAVDKTNRGILRCYSTKENIGVMTNSPSYERQLQNLSWFLANSPEMRQGIRGQAIRELWFDGRRVTADENAVHVSLSGDFPGSFASYDRFLRLAIVKALNQSGNHFIEEEMLPLGSHMMNVVMEPNTGGIFHYTQRKEDGSIIGQKESFTQYIVMYDLEEKCFYIRVFDMVSWKKYRLIKIADGEKKSYEITHSLMQGVIMGNGNCD